MGDPRVETVAEILVDYSVQVRPKQLVRISGGAHGAPLILAVYRKVLEHGAYPFLRVEPEEVEELFYTYASGAQLDYIPPFTKDMIEQINASIGIWTDVNTKQLNNADPAKQSRRAVAMRPLSDRFLERAAKKEMRWRFRL
jgi:aminopeptidase